ncbi:MAG: polysaccharide biosynthesis tyrosine autokinase [Deltaproteobacteria bacterium]|nr:polysaccharide biosynthesis tyrosine autokinase [Deltaproteobacteria bacterium]
MEIKDHEIHLLDYWRVLVKRRKVFFAVMALIVGVTVVYSFVATPIYSSAAQILFELEKNPTMTFAEGEGGYVQMKESKEYFNTQTEIIKSRAFADRVVRKLELGKNAYFLGKKEGLNNVPLYGTIKWLGERFSSHFRGASKGKDPFLNVPLEEEVDPALTDIVLDNMGVEIARDTNIMRVVYYDGDPRAAAVMANGIAASYIEHNLDIRVRPFKDAVDWLSAKIVELKGRVETSERVLQRYKEKENIVSFEAKENIITQELSEIISEVVQADAKRQDSEARYKQIKGVIDKPELLTTVPDIMNSLVIQGLRKDELDLKKEISMLSGKYGEKHPQMIKAKTELEMVEKNILDEARKMLNAAKTEYEIAKSREDSLKTRLEEQKQAVLKLSKKAIDFNVVAGEAFSNKEFYELLLKKLQEASLSSGINISNAQVVDRAIISPSPVSPAKAFNVLIAAIVGLFTGVMAVFFVEYMDDTLKTPEDVREFLGAPFLGYVPAFTAGKGDESGLLPVISHPRSPAAEAYRTLRTGIVFSSAQTPLKVILVTSSLPREGKTVTSSNLAAAMAQTGERVILVDGDLRRSDVHNVFGMENSDGLTNLIVENHEIDRVVKKVAAQENLELLTSGAHTPNPAELVGSKKMRELLLSLRERYDRIIIDSPPLMAVSDPIILSDLVDGVIFVVWGGNTGKEPAKDSMRYLSGANARITGVVLNNLAPAKAGSYYYYQYYHTYADAEKNVKPV